MFTPFHISRTIFLVKRILRATMLKSIIVITANTGYIVLVVVYVIFQYMSDVIEIFIIIIYNRTWKKKYFPKWVRLTTDHSQLFWTGRKLYGIFKTSSVGMWKHMYKVLGRLLNN